MATVSAKVFKHHKKTDGTYNVKICVHHNEQRKYFDTAHYLVKKQLTVKMVVKDEFINDLLYQQLRGYRKLISELGSRIEFFIVSLEEMIWNMLKTGLKSVICIIITHFQTAGRAG